MSEDEPIEYFLEDIRHHGRSERTTVAYDRVLTDFEQFLSKKHGKSSTEADYRECMSYIHTLRAEKSESTVATYASYLNRFYSYLIRVGKHEDNPMSIVIEEMDESIDTDPDRRDVSVNEMRTFVRSIQHPLHRSVVVLLLKTGIRSGELCNLDLRDINFSKNEGVNWTPRAALSGRPGTLYVSDEHTYGKVSNGEVRNASNKRKRNTIIPIDGETENELRRWLTIRPNVCGNGSPLFVGTSKSWGQRLTPDMVHHMIESHTRGYGWYRDGGTPEENVTPHYFRHFFTTYLRDSIGDRGVVKYLRGDVGEDIIDTYTHDWGDRIRETYLEHIYSITDLEI